MGDERFAWFVGIDWGTQHHQVHVADAQGTALADRVVPHTAEALTAFVAWLTALASGQLGRVAIGIEATRGALVETLVARGAAVFAVNPKQLDRFRDRHSVAGAKDDRLDALVLQSAVRTDRHLFRRLALDEAHVIQVRELTRAQEELTDEGVRLTNRLREQVHRIAPAWLTVCEAADEPWFWALLKAAPTPAHGRRLRLNTVQRILRQHRIRRLTAAEVQAVLQAPAMYVAPGTVEATAQHIALLLPRLRLVWEQQRQCEQQLETLLTALANAAEAAEDEGASGPGVDAAGGSPAAPRGEGPPPPSVVAIVRSAPGVGPKITGALVAHAMPMLREPDLLALRATAGTAPVTRRTGKDPKGRVGMRYACNAVLREALFHWAQCSIRVTEGDHAARQYYATLRAKGHSHARALRSVGDRWLRILVAMLKSRTVYDPARFARRTAVAVQPATA